MGVAVAIACFMLPSAASATPPLHLAANATSSEVAASRAALDAAIDEYDAAQARLSTIQASLESSTEQIEVLVTRQEELEVQLAQRARTMYRTGPIGFVEVLAGSADFRQFMTVWDALIRFNRREAETIAEVESTRARVEKVTSGLLDQQTEMSRQLRELDAAKRRARSDLARSRALYAEYQRRIAAREAASAESAGAPDPALGTTQPSTPRATGSGAWKTALASHYGEESYGVRLSSGVTIGPDSMIVAHKTLPFGTLVEFSYKGRVAVAQVADRGPYVAGREFDLGPGIIRVLGFRGVDTVRYRILGR
jgi:rare lipoprotein A (peptidoglycan hydrolase)